LDTKGEQAGANRYEKGRLVEGPRAANSPTPSNDESADEERQRRKPQGTLRSRDV
jgi:hypothetical protein